MTNDQFLHHRTILFADIAGSTALYEQLGDANAQRLIGQTLEKVGAVVAAHRGSIIKTIGDELMCSFDSPSDALHASCAIHDMLDQKTETDGERLHIRIGMHTGPAILKENDLFGDAVNVTARIAALAKGQQTLTTAQTVESLTPADAAFTRRLDFTPVKGKAEALVLHEVIWRQENMTVLHMNRTRTSGGSSKRVVLTYQDQTRAIHGDSHTAFTLGRDTSCNLQILSKLASRQHGRIEHRMGKFVYVDHGANGTYISLKDINNLFLHREELPLFGSGVIACGEKIQDGCPHLIHFSCD